MSLDYETLQVICWIVVGLLLVGFVVINGIDMGTGMLVPFISKSETDRWVLVNTIAHSRGSNQLWLVAAGAAIVTAWPQILAITSRGLSLLLLVTFTIYFLRPVGLVYRNKLEATRWGFFWDWGIFTGSIAPPLVLGVLFSSLLTGVPFHIDEFQQVIYPGSFWLPLNPFALLVGLVFVSMVATHGGTWLQFNTSGYIYQRARVATVMAAFATSLSFISGGLVLLWLDGYVITASVATGASANALHKSVQLVGGAWLSNFRALPALWLVPALGMSLPWLTIYLTRKNYSVRALLSSSLTLVMIIVTTGIVLFPFIVPSSLNPSHSLTIWDAASSAKKLSILMWLAIIFFSVVLSYAGWRCCRIFYQIRAREAVFS